MERATRLVGVDFVAALESLRRQVCHENDEGIALQAEYSDRGDTLMPSRLTIHGLRHCGPNGVLFWGIITLDGANISHLAEGSFDPSTKSGSWSLRKIGVAISLG